MAITIPLNPPTSQLPPIAKIKAVSLQDISDAIAYLRLLYNPEVRGTRWVDRKLVFNASRIATGPTETFNEAHSLPSRKSSTSNVDSSLDALRADEFERTYAIRWLTVLVSRADTLITRDGRYGQEDSSFSEAYELAWENTIQDAAALLAVCAGTASAGLVARAFAFRHAAGHEVKVQITDVPLENQDFSSVGAQTWGSACLLAEMIVDSPPSFGLDRFDSSNGPMRVLELGAGTGLVSLSIGGLLSGLLENSTVTGAASVVATDFHPSVLGNLHKNIALNTATWPASSRLSISAHHLDWSNLPPTPSSPPFDQPFDVVFGADIVYEIEHARWVHNCVERFLRKPSHAANNTTPKDTPRFHLMMPLRPTHAAESQAVEEIFPLAAESPSESPVGSVLRTVLKETLLCEVQSGSHARSTDTATMEYVQYTIQWV